MQKAKLHISVHGHHLADIEIDLDSLSPAVMDILINPAATGPMGPIFSVNLELPRVRQVLLGHPAACVRAAFISAANG